MVTVMGIYTMVKKLQSDFSRIAIQNAENVVEEIDMHDVEATDINDEE